MALRDVTIKVRNRQTTGGSIPGTALMGEPFVNLFDGVLNFSGVTGGSFEPTTQTGIFEVGSKLYNQRILNRLSINDNFIVSGGTGIISTYAGASGAGLSGKFLSGTTAGFVVANIADIAASTDSYTTGATWVPNLLTLNLNQGRPSVPVTIDSFTALTIDGNLTITGNTSAQSLSAVTLFSGSTNVGNLFVNTVNAGSNVNVTGSANHPIVNVNASPSFNNINYSGTSIGGNSIATNVSATTFYSASTNLETIIYNIAASTENITSIGNGLNTYTGGTPSAPTVNVSAATLDHLSVSGATDLKVTTTTNLTVNGNLTITGNTSAQTLSAITLYSGTTNVGNLFVNTVNAGSNINVSGSANHPVVNVDASPVFNNITSSALTATRITFAGTAGILTDDSNLTFNSGTDVVTIGGAGNLTTNGTQYSGGTIVDDGVFVLDAVTSVDVDSNLNPTTTLAYDLGITSQRWRTLNVRDVNASGSITATGATLSGLLNTGVVYVGTGGELKTESPFYYDENANTLHSEKLIVGIPGQTGTTATIYGDVLVIGDAISGFTSELYIEDNLIELNFNPTASTISTSLGAGFSIQDGAGVTGGTDVYFDIRGTSTGLANRSFATNLEDIRIRETGTISAPTGMRVLAENDILDGGSF